MYNVIFYQILMFFKFLKISSFSFKFKTSSLKSSFCDYIAIIYFLKELLNLWIGKSVIAYIFVKRTITITEDGNDDAKRADES